MPSASHRLASAKRSATRVTQCIFEARVPGCDTTLTDPPSPRCSWFHHSSRWFRFLNKKHFYPFAVTSVVFRVYTINWLIYYMYFSFKQCVLFYRYAFLSPFPCFHWLFPSKLAYGCIFTVLLISFSLHFYVFTMFNFYFLRHFPLSLSSNYTFLFSSPRFHIYSFFLLFFFYGYTCFPLLPQRVRIWQYLQWLHFH